MSVLDRLEGCAERIAQLRGDLKVEMQRRNGLLVEAMNDRYSYREVSRSVHLAPSRIANIVGEEATRA